MHPNACGSQLAHQHDTPKVKDLQAYHKSQPSSKHSLQNKPQPVLQHKSKVTQLLRSPGHDQKASQVQSSDSLDGCESEAEASCDSHGTHGSGHKCRGDGLQTSREDSGDSDVAHPARRFDAQAPYGAAYSPHGCLEGGHHSHDAYQVHQVKAQNASTSLPSSQQALQKGPPLRSQLAQSVRIEASKGFSSHLPGNGPDDRSSQLMSAWQPLSQYGGQPQLEQAWQLSSRQSLQHAAKSGSDFPQAVGAGGTSQHGIWARLQHEHALQHDNASQHEHTSQHTSQHKHASQPGTQLAQLVEGGSVLRHAQSAGAGGDSQIAQSVRAVGDSQHAHSNGSGRAGRAGRGGPSDFSHRLPDFTNSSNTSTSTSSVSANNTTTPQHNNFVHANNNATTSPVSANNAISPQHNDFPYATSNGNISDHNYATFTHHNNITLPHRSNESLLCHKNISTSTSGPGFGSPPSPSFGSNVHS